LSANSIAALGLGKAGEEPIADGIIWLDLDQIVHIQPAPSLEHRPLSKTAGIPQR
jgi:hypothetical protein